MEIAANRLRTHPDDGPSPVGDAVAGVPTRSNVPMNPNLGFAGIVIIPGCIAIALAVLVLMVTIHCYFGNVCPENFQ